MHAEEPKLRQNYPENNNLTTQNSEKHENDIAYAFIASDS